MKMKRILSCLIFVCVLASVFILPGMAAEEHPLTLTTNLPPSKIADRGTDVVISGTATQTSTVMGFIFDDKNITFKTYDVVNDKYSLSFPANGDCEKYYVVIVHPFKDGKYSMIFTGTEPTSKVFFLDENTKAGYLKDFSGFAGCQKLQTYLNNKHSDDKFEVYSFTVIDNPAVSKPTTEQTAAAIPVQTTSAVYVPTSAPTPGQTVASSTDGVYSFSLFSGDMMLYIIGAAALVVVIIVVVLIVVIRKKSKGKKGKDTTSATVSQPKQKSNAKAEKKSKAKTEQKSEQKPEPKPEPVPEPIPEPKPEAKPEPEPVAAPIQKEEPASDAGNKPKFCDNCGAKIEPGMRFCAECGKELK